MVARYGMSKRLGTISYLSDDEVFIGGSYGKTKSYSEQVAGQIDEEVKTGIDRACSQLLLTAENIDGTGQMPRSIWVGYDLDMLSYQLGKNKEEFKDSLRAHPGSDKIGKLRLCGIYDWTSGFFPGSLWYAYELKGDEALKDAAIRYTNKLNPIREYKGTHDLGFMMNCSYGNALRLSPSDTIPAVLIQTADNLCSRFGSHKNGYRQPS